MRGCWLARTVGCPPLLADLGRNDLYQIYLTNSAGVVNTATQPYGFMYAQPIDLLMCPSDSAKLALAQPTTAERVCDPEALAHKAPFELRRQRGLSRPINVTSS